MQGTKFIKFNDVSTSFYSPMLGCLGADLVALHTSSMRVDMRATGKFSRDRLVPEAMEVDDFLTELFGTEYNEVLRPASKTVAEEIAAHEGETLEVLRLRAGLTQSELAALSKIPQPRISNYENGQIGTITLATARRLADALGVDAPIVMEAFERSKDS